MAQQNNPQDKEQESIDNDGAQAQPGKENVVAAHDQAEADIENDPEMNLDEEPGDDLDEGELARLDNDNDTTDLV